MSNPRENREQDARAGSSDLAQATASGGMIAVVAVILLASWILKADPHRGGPSAARATSASMDGSARSEGTPWNMAPLSRVDAEATPPSEETAPVDGTAAPEAVASLPEIPAAPASSSPPPETLPSSLDTRELTAIQVRAARDLQRLAARREGWIAQVAAVCNEDRVAAHVQSVGSSDRLYILPVMIKERSCYRMLWGTYDSAAAAAAADLPSTLKSGEKLRVLAVKELIP